MLTAVLVLLFAGQVQELTPFPDRPVEQSPVITDSLPPARIPPLPPEPPLPGSLAAGVVPPPLPAPRRPDRWLAMDKFWHFSASFVTVGAGYHLLDARLNTGEPTATAGALGGTVALGVAKEFYDVAGRKESFSWKDLVFDLLGVGAGYLVFVHGW